MEDNKEEGYEPVDFKVNKDLKSIKAKASRGGANFPTLLGVFVFLLLIVMALFAFYYRPWPTSQRAKMEDLVQGQKSTLESLQQEQEALRSNMAVFQKGKGWIAEEAQPLADTLEVKIQTTDRLIKELTAQVKALDELIQD